MELNSVNFIVQASTEESLSLIATLNNMDLLYASLLSVISPYLIQYTTISKASMDLRQIPHQPKYYDNILCYVKRGVQITQVDRIGSHSILFPCRQLVHILFLHILSVHKQFPTQITSTRWLKNRALSSNKIKFWVLCKVYKKISKIL